MTEHDIITLTAAQLHAAVLARLAPLSPVSGPAIASAVREAIAIRAEAAKQLRDAAGLDDQWPRAIDDATRAMMRQRAIAAEPDGLRGPDGNADWPLDDYRSKDNLPF